MTSTVRLCLLLCLRLAVNGILTAPASAQTDAARPPTPPNALDIRLSPVREHVKRDEITHSKALTEVGVLAQDGYVLYGIELHPTGDTEPAVKLALKQTATVGEALRQIFDQLPGYRFETVSEHLINVYPEGAKDDAGDVLNTLISEFNVSNEPPGNVQAHPEDFMPELRKRLMPGAADLSPPFGRGLRSAGPGITLHLSGRTVREILNAVTEAQTVQMPPDWPPAGWLYVEKPDGTRCWSVHHSVLAGWKERERARLGK
jgi:hypothetical protein